MGRSRTLSLAAALGLLGASALSGAPAPPLPLASTIAPPISGTVRSVQVPVAGALVVLYNVAETSLARLRTATDGTFVVAFEGRAGARYEIGVVRPGGGSSREVVEFPAEGGDPRDGYVGRAVRFRP